MQNDFHKQRFWRTQHNEQAVEHSRWFGFLLVEQNKKDERKFEVRVATVCPKFLKKTVQAAAAAFLLASTASFRAQGSSSLSAHRQGSSEPPPPKIACPLYVVFILSAALYFLASFPTPPHLAFTTSHLPSFSKLHTSMPPSRGRILHELAQHWPLRVHSVHVLLHLFQKY